MQRHLVGLHGPKALDAFENFANEEYYPTLSEAMDKFIAEVTGEGKSLYARFLKLLDGRIHPHLNAGEGSQAAYSPENNVCILFFNRWCIRIELEIHLRTNTMVLKGKCREKDQTLLEGILQGDPQEVIGATPFNYEGLEFTLKKIIVN